MASVHASGGNVNAMRRLLYAALAWRRRENVDLAIPISKTCRAVLTIPLFLLKKQIKPVS